MHLPSLGKHSTTTCMMHLSYCPRRQYRLVGLLIHRFLPCDSDSLLSKSTGWGPRPLFELLAEIVCGAPSMERIERYARLSREHGDFIRENDGDQFSPKFLIVKGND
jgi:hypothetical protein